MKIKVYQIDIPEDNDGMWVYYYYNGDNKRLWIKWTDSISEMLKQIIEHENKQIYDDKTKIVEEIRILLNKLLK